MRKRGMQLFLAVYLFCLPAIAQAEVSSVRQTPTVKVVKENAEAVVNIGTERIILLREKPYWGQYGSEFDFFFKS